MFFHWIIRRKITALEKYIHRARDLLLVSQLLHVVFHSLTVQLTQPQGIQAQMQPALAQVFHGSETEPDRQRESLDWGTSTLEQSARLRVGTANSPLSNGRTFDSPQAHLDFRGRIIHVTQIINTGSGNVSGCTLSGTS